MIRLLAATATVVALATDADAQITIPAGVMPSFNFQFVEPTLQAAGVPYRRVEINEGYSILEITIDGTTFRAAPTACKDAMCAGFLMEAFAAKAMPVDQMTNFNASNHIVKVSRPNGGSTTFVHRYLIGDYGYVRGSFIVNLMVFASLVKKFENELGAGAGTKVSFEAPEMSLPSAPVAPGTKILGDDFADKFNARQKSLLISGDAWDATALPAESSLHEQPASALLWSEGNEAHSFNHVD